MNAGQFSNIGFKEHAGAAHFVFNPSEIEEKLTDFGVAKLSKPEIACKIDSDFVDLVERLFLKFQKTNVFWPEDDANQQIVGHRYWNLLRGLLLKYEILTLHVRPKSGGYGEGLKRHVLPDQLLNGLFGVGMPNPAIKGFWREAPTSPDG